MLNVPECAVKFCKSNGRKGVQMFRVPRSKNRQIIWLQMMGRDDEDKNRGNNSKNLRGKMTH